MNESPPLKEIATSPTDVLDPADPMRSARALVEKEFTQDGLRTLHRHRATFWVWNGTHYQSIEDEAMRSRIWRYLETAQTSVANRKGDITLIPFSPTRGKVDNVGEALKALCELDDKLEAPGMARGKVGEEVPCAQLVRVR